MADSAEQIENGEITDAYNGVRDSVMAAVTSLQEAENVEPDPENADPAPEPEPVEADPENVASDAGKPGDEGSEPAEQAGDDGSGRADPVESTEEPEEVILAPASWSKEDREVFAKADDDLKKIVARRETERDSHLNQIARESGPLRAVAEEYRDYFHQVGLSPEQSFRVLVNTERLLRFGTPQQKSEALQKIARDYDVPLAAPTQAAQQSEEDYADPGLARLENVFSERLGKIEGQLSSRQQADDDAQQNQANTTAAQFFDKLDGAKPDEFPEARYAEQVMPRFNTLVVAERSSGAMPSVDRLVELYRDAAYSTPGVREALASDAAARAEAERKAAEARTTRTVKTTSSSASGGSGVVAHSDDDEKPLSVRESVLRAKRTLEAQQ